MLVNFGVLKINNLGFKCNFDMISIYLLLIIKASSSVSKVFPMFEFSNFFEKYEEFCFAVLQEKKRMDKLIVNYS